MSDKKSDLEIYPWKLDACRANNNYFLYISFIFCSLYFLLFLIILYRTIVTVYNDNIFLYNYLWQMHQIIYLSPMGCFTPARGKTVQKNHEVSGVKGTVLEVIRFSSFFKNVFKNYYGIGNNVWKFQVSTMKIVLVASIWSSCVISIIMTQSFRKRNNIW